MAQRLGKNHDLLNLLVNCTPAQCKVILKVADDALVRTICECILNVLKETGEKKTFSSQEITVTLVEKSTPIERKDKIVVRHDGDFLSVLLPPVLCDLSSILV